MSADLARGGDLVAPRTIASSVAAGPVARPGHADAGSVNAAIAYSGSNFDTHGPRLMGRHSASESFLRALVRHGGLETIYCHAASQREFEDFTKRVTELGGNGQATKWIPFHRGEQLSEPGCLYRPGPDIGHFAWLRRRHGERRYSICGVTHTTAEHQVMDHIGNLLVAPVQRWDALVCTSRAVRSMVMHLLENWSAYLSARFGGKADLLPQLPVIPLGVDCDAFAPSEESERWAKQFRASQQIAEQDIVVLFVGRLNPIEKANPLPMYKGLQAAAQRTGRRIHLVQAGWFASREMEQVIRQGAREYAPDVRHLFVDGRRPDVRRNIWSAADIFTSLPDNIQETFGLTPIEAMAAGLPIVASDWDGYRETVRHGEDGLLVPTLMPAAGSGEELAVRYASYAFGYGGYCASTSQCISVDTAAAGEAYATLIEQPDLRRRMGKAGQERARVSFDWRVIIAAYQELWAELAERRRRDPLATPRQPGRPALPLRDDPFALFASYATKTLGADTMITRASDMDPARMKQLRASGLTGLSQAGLLSPAASCRLLAQLDDRTAVSVGSLLEKVQASQRPEVLRTLGWLARPD